MKNLNVKLLICWDLYKLSIFHNFEELSIFQNFGVVSTCPQCVFPCPHVPKTWGTLALRRQVQHCFWRYFLVLFSKVILAIYDKKSSFWPALRREKKVKFSKNLSLKHKYRNRSSMSRLQSPFSSTKFIFFLLHPISEFNSYSPVSFIGQ